MAALSKHDPVRPKLERGGAFGNDGQIKKPHTMQKPETNLSDDATQDLSPVTCNV